MSPSRPRGRLYYRPIMMAQRAATKLHTFVYQATNGKVGGRLLGAPVLLLTTTIEQSKVRLGKLGKPLIKSIKEFIEDDMTSYAAALSFWVF
ncbi:MAG TPA: hypothetical protein VK361_07160, partial [Rubrobacteraceae bacterium]|nr:hypothetical protein [Rubrobacteraceae bacterium]